jgi:hypothetical protein
MTVREGVRMAHSVTVLRLRRRSGVTPSRAQPPRTGEGSFQRPTAPSVALACVEPGRAGVYGELRHAKACRA